MHGALWVDDTTPVEMVSANNHRPVGIVVHRGPHRRRRDLRSTRDRRDDACTHRPGSGDANCRATRRSDISTRLPAQRYHRGRRPTSDETLPGTGESALPGNAIGLMDGGSQSPKETWLRLLLIDAGVPTAANQIRSTSTEPVADHRHGLDHRSVPSSTTATSTTDRATYVKRHATCRTRRPSGLVEHSSRDGRSQIDHPRASARRWIVASEKAWS